MKSETNRRNDQSPPTCWQREGPSACLRIEISGSEAHLFPYQHFVAASLHHVDGGETLRLAFSTHDVQIDGRNLRQLLLALQEFAVKWMRPIPSRYQLLDGGDDGVISRIRITEAQ